MKPVHNKNVDVFAKIRSTVLPTVKCRSKESCQFHEINTTLSL